MGHGHQLPQARGMNQNIAPRQLHFQRHRIVKVSVFCWKGYVYIAQMEGSRGIVQKYRHCLPDEYIHKHLHKNCWENYN